MSSSIKLTERKEDTNKLLTEEIMAGLQNHLPRLYKLAKEMNLVYSLDQHGISLSTLYHRTEKVIGPIMLVLKDEDNNVFGAFLNQTLKKWPRYYGTGECFLWKWDAEKSKVNVYAWTGKNEYMVLSEVEFVAVGGGDGKFGLWFDSKLEKGYSEQCPTFDNEPLAPKNKFECFGLEVWGFRI